MITIDEANRMVGCKVWVVSVSTPKGTSADTVGAFTVGVYEGRVNTGQLRSGKAAGLTVHVAFRRKPGGAEVGMYEFDRVYKTEAEAKAGGMAHVEAMAARFNASFQDAVRQLS